MSGVPVGTLSKIAAGITKDPKLETVKAIARALECTLDDLDMDTPTLIKSQKEHAHLTKYRALDERGRAAVDATLDREYEATQKAKEESELERLLHSNQDDIILAAVDGHGIERHKTDPEKRDQIQQAIDKIPPFKR